MSHLNKQDSLTNQTKTLDDLDHYITLLTLKTHQKLGFYETQNGINHSQAQEQTNRFYGFLKTLLEHKADARKKSANLSIENASILKKNSIKKFTTATTVGAGGMACLTYGTILHTDPLHHHQTLEQLQMKIEPNLNGKVMSSDEQSQQALREEQIENLGEMILFGGGIYLIGAAAYLANDCIKDRKKKRDSQQASKYLHEDYYPILKLICSLYTLYNLEQLTQDSNQNESEINQRAEKECSLLLKNITKKDRKLPHRITDKLLSAYSFTPEYALEERISLLRHWFGAFEASIKKDRPSKEWDLFLNELDTLDQKIERSKREHHLNKPTGLHATNPNNLFSLPQNNESSIEKSNNLSKTQQNQRLSARI